MAKEVAIGLLELRAQADSHHHAWSAESVEAIEISAFETIGVEDRAQFYEQTGALRDVVQGHLMQLLALVLMQPPPLEHIHQLPEARTKALQQLHPADPAHSTRAQYDGYAEEVNNPGSTVETFVSIDLRSHDDRWLGVPIRLATGKQLHEKKTAITLTYRDGSKDTFVEGEVSSSFDGLSEAYERVLVAAMNGEKHLFTTSDEIRRSWEVLAPLQKAWEMGDRPLHRYEKQAHAATIHLKHYI